MFKLLVDAYTPWSEIADDCQYTTFSEPRIDDELLHASGQCILGFDYTTAVGDEREYVFSVIRWVATKVGRRRRQFRSENIVLERPVPYWRPAGFETRPILVAEEWEAVPGIPLYNRYGVSDEGQTVRDLAWYHIPDGAHERVAATHYDKSPQEIRDALVKTGREGAMAALQLIEAHICRLDTLWAEP